jgi:flagellar M-ring protein FliF
MGNMGTMINAGALILVSLLILFLGLKPALRAILELPGPADTAANSALGGAMLPAKREGDLPGMAGGSPFAIANLGGPEPDLAFDQLARGINNTPQTRLGKIVELDTARAAEVLKGWLTDSEKSAA